MCPLRVLLVAAFVAVFVGAIDVAVETNYAEPHCRGSVVHRKNWTVGECYNMSAESGGVTSWRITECTNNTHQIRWLLYEQSATCGGIGRPEVWNTGTCMPGYVTPYNVWSCLAVRP